MDCPFLPRASTGIFEDLFNRVRSPALIPLLRIRTSSLKQSSPRTPSNRALPDSSPLFIVGSATASVSDEDDLNAIARVPIYRESLSLPEKLQCLELMKDGVLGDYPDEESLWTVSDLPLEHLMGAASEIRDRGAYSQVISFSPKVFIPLTMACRDACGYCTFAVPWKSGKPLYMRIEHVLEIADRGKAAGCTEALFTLGDKPELLYSQAREELAALGHETTVTYVAEVAKVVLKETGLIPHINAGVMPQSDIAHLKHVSASQGLMLESTSERLLRPGGAHYRCPDKVPSARLASIAAAGKEKVPFTSGILVGIGESRKERIQSLLELRKLHKSYGHIQELIIQNFCAKVGTLMEHALEPTLEELQWTIAITRLAFGPYMNIQAPPNLTPTSYSLNSSEAWKSLIKAGINDWGGISPITKDWVNPEAPWPHLCQLAASVMDAGKLLVPRLPIYPQYIKEPAKWLHADVLGQVLEHSNSLGFARGEAWSPGTDAKLIGEMHGPNIGPVIVGGNLLCGKEMIKERICVGVSGAIQSTVEMHTKVPSSTRMDDILQAAFAGDDLKEDDISSLFTSMGPEFEQIRHVADELRVSVNGDKVTYVVNRNINYTNVCSYKCQFCAFSKGKANEILRGKSYMLSLEEIGQRVKEAWDRGATEVCMQGGIHPVYTGKTYLDILRYVKESVPEIHVHAFSPLEVHQGAETLGLSVREFLVKLKEAGLGSLPGTAAEILDDDIRNILCPDKISTQKWLHIMKTAHEIGLRSTATIMFGHVDGPKHWARHLLQVRGLQKVTGGFTEFVPLPFVHMEAPIFLKGYSRKGPTRRECILMHAVSRLVLHPFIKNIQASWVKMGPNGAQSLLMAGCNDMGGSLMNESISRAAGASFGQELGPVEMESLISSLGRTPQQRTTLYGTPDPVQIAKSFEAAPLHPTCA